MLSIGFARTDITVYEPEIAMLGWGQLHNRVGGVAAPLYARAMFLADAQGNPLAYVCCDLLLISEAVRRAVLERLGGLAGLGEHEVVLCATHTHSGPSGYSEYFWKSLASPGFSRHVFDGIVDGIVDAIRDAYAARQPGQAWLIQGELPLAEAVAFNRSWRAYNRNPDVTPVTFERRDEATERTMTLLRFDDAHGQPLGALCWFALHGTCVHADNRLLHPDHKGLAAQALEDSGPGAPPFAIFAQEAAGDVSPNFRFDPRRGVTVGRFDDDFESAAHVAAVQARLARALFDAAPEQGLPLDGPIDSAVRYIDFSCAEIDPALVDQRPGLRTWPARIGVSMAMGTAEGPGPLGPMPWLAQSLNRAAGALHRARARVQPDYLRPDDPKWPLFDLWRGAHGRLAGLLPLHRHTLPPVDPILRYARNIVLAGAISDTPFMPQVLPVQLARIGPLAIAALTFETTTVCGRRLRAALARALAAHGVERVVVNPYANAYSGYLTTFDEYQLQAYEGGYTLFGPHSLAAVQTALVRLGETLTAAPRHVRDPGARPPAIPPDELARRPFAEAWPLTPRRRPQAPTHAPA